MLNSRMETTDDFQFTTSLVEYLIHLVGPHPFFLHIAAYHAYQALSQDKNIKSKDEFCLLDEPIEVEADSHLGYLWHNLSEEEQYALAIADGPIDSLRLLEQQCLIEQVDSGKYAYTSDILRRFVRRQQVTGLNSSGSICD